jgi:hypothetical protein
VRGEILETDFDFMTGFLFSPKGRSVFSFPRREEHVFESIGAERRTEREAIAVPAASRRLRRGFHLDPISFLRDIRQR